MNRGSRRKLYIDAAEALLFGPRTREIELDWLKFRMLGRERALLANRNKKVHQEKSAI